MKHFALILIFLCAKAYSQTIFKFDTNSFLLGLIDDYNGRTIALEREESANYIATVNPELSKIFLDSITKVYNIPKAEITIKGNSFFNKNIAQKINQFFSAEIDPDMDEYDEKSNTEYKIYVLDLNKKKFETSAKKLSFLAGMFYNCGSLVNDEVIFKTANSSNFNVALDFISDLGFAYCEEPKREYNMPTVQIVTFKPTSEYIYFFRNLKSKKQNGW